MIEGVIFQALKYSGAAWLASIADYHGEKAIFSAGLPEDAAFPALLISAAGGRDWGCRDTTGGELRVDVQVFDDKSESAKALTDLAWAVYEFLNRNTLDPYLGAAGYTNVGCQADPPTRTNDGFGFPGFAIPLMVRVAKN